MKVNDLRYKVCYKDGGWAKVVSYPNGLKVETTHNINESDTFTARTLFSLSSLEGIFLYASSWRAVPFPTNKDMSKCRRLYAEYDVIRDMMQDEAHNGDGWD